MTACTYTKNWYHIIMLNNNKGRERAQGSYELRQKVFLCWMCYNEHWPTTTTTTTLHSSRNARGGERGLHGKFLFYPFLFHLCHCELLLLCVYTFSLLLHSSSPTTTDWQDTQPSDYLIFRKRFQEILIGILCICFEAKQEERKRNCLNTEN